MSGTSRVPFNRPYMTGKELEYIAHAHANGHLSGDGPFTRRCHEMLAHMTGAQKALLTHSCTAALEMAAILLDVGPGDEVIMPSYTFVSTASAFTLRGAVPVFVDIRPDTLNIDERLIEAAITPRTRGICVVHYAGVPCEMAPILEIAKRHGLFVVEDAAQGLGAAYHGRPLGSIGDLATLSFHETKNVISGEGGALLINRTDLIERAEIVREKGTNRSHFIRGQVDKYTWVDLGSSYLPSELVSAFLTAQLEAEREITTSRLEIWNTYHAWARYWEELGMLRRPTIPGGCTHNAHMYYLIMRTQEERDAFIDHMRRKGIMVIFHYVPLHSSPTGSRLGRTGSTMQYTDDLSGRLVRLPLWIGVSRLLGKVTAAADDFFRNRMQMTRQEPSMVSPDGASCPTAPHIAVISPRHEGGNQ